MSNVARNSQIADPGVSGHDATRRRYRYRRRHRPHFYAVVTAVSGAVLVCIVNAVGYLTGDIYLAEVAFGCALATALLIFLAFFLGITMLMSGHMPARRIRVLFCHGAVGMLSPLFYTVNISIELDRWAQPVSGTALIVSMAFPVLLAIQVAMGRAVVRPDPIRIVR